MKHNHFKILRGWHLTIFLLIFSFNSKGQEIVAAAGNSISSGSGSASITVGQVSYQFVDDAGGSTSEGVQQAFEIFTLPLPETYQAAQEELNKSGIVVTTKVYPNPTNSDITLSHQGQSIAGLSYRLYDLQGRLISQQEIRFTQQPVAMQQLASGSYVLHICKNQIPVNSFKIIKN